MHIFCSVSCNLFLFVDNTVLPSLKYKNIFLVQYSLFVLAVVTRKQIILAFKLYDFEKTVFEDSFIECLRIDVTGEIIDIASICNTLLCTGCQF